MSDQQNRSDTKEAERIIGVLDSKMQYTKTVQKETVTVFVYSSSFFFFCNLFTHGALRSSLELVETCPSVPDRIQVIKKHFRMDKLPNFSLLWGFPKKQRDTKSQMPIAYLQRVFDCFLIPRMKRVDYLPELRRSPLEMNLVAKIQEKPNVSRPEMAIQVHAMVKVVKQTNH